MTDAALPHARSDASADDTPLDVDAVVVGAGMSGLYALKVLREQGLRTVVLERAAGVGGTWFWNRYPGARCDIPSLEYSFGFDPELEQEWVWTEHFAAQPEIERYLNHIADRYDLRRDIRLSTGVSAMTFDEATNTWLVETEAGDVLRTRFCIMATGGLSAPNRPDYPGIDSFEGTIVQTSMWPEEGVELAGKRIGVIGTGSSGVQTIPELAHPRSRGRRRTSRSPTSIRPASRPATESCASSSTRPSAARPAPRAR
jgi:cation diffusion facilitator CzcD-associated flavoprotein CzcO